MAGAEEEPPGPQWPWRRSSTQFRRRLEVDSGWWRQPFSGIRPARAGRSARAATCSTSGPAAGKAGSGDSPPGICCRIKCTLGQVQPAGWVSCGRKTRRTGRAAVVFELRDHGSCNRPNFGGAGEAQVLGQPFQRHCALPTAGGACSVWRFRRGWIRKQVLIANKRK